MPPKLMNSTKAEKELKNDVTPLKQRLDFLQESTRVTEVKRGRPPKDAAADKNNPKDPKSNRQSQIFNFPPKFVATDEESVDDAAQKVRDAKGRGRQDFNWSDDPWGLEQFQNPEVEKNDYEHAME